VALDQIRPSRGGEIMVVGGIYPLDGVRAGIDLPVIGYLPWSERGSLAAVPDGTGSYTRGIVLETDIGRQ